MVILGTAAWIYLWLWLFGPIAAGLWCRSIVAWAFVCWRELGAVEIEQPDELAEPVDLRRELECRGRHVPDRYFDREAA